MLRLFYNLLYAGTSVQFETHSSVSESVRRLARDVKPSAIQTLFRESAIGIVSKSRVRLYRQPAFYSNPFQPVFIGSFTTTDGQTVLSGTFTLRLFVKILMSVWFTAALTFCVTGLAFLIVKRDAETALALVASIGMILLVAAIVHFCKRVAHQDVDWLTSKITDAFADSAP